MACNNTAIPHLSWQREWELPEIPKGKAHPGLAGAVAGISNGVFLIGGGANFPDTMPWNGGTKHFYHNIRAWSIPDAKASAGWITEDTLPEPVAYAALGNEEGIILVAGGENKNGPSKRAFYLFAEYPQQKIKYVPLPDLPKALTNAAGFLFQQNMYVAGGETSGGAVADVWRLSLQDTAAGWQQIASLPYPVSHGVLGARLSETGSVTLYFAGGRHKQPNGISKHYADAWEWITGENTWKSLPSLPYGISAAGAAVYQNNYWIICSGDKGETFGKVEQLLTAIAAAKDTAEKAKLLAEKARLQENHPGFSTEVHLYSFADKKWHIAGKIPFDGPVTAPVFISANKLYIASGEIRAGIRTPFIISATITGDNN